MPHDVDIRAEGIDAATELPWPLPEHIGADTGEVVVVPQPDAIVAYRASE